MAGRTIDLGWMRLLVEIGRRGSLSATARALGLSQPAVSYQIRQLEQSFAVPILRRLHRGVSLTEEGTRLFEIALRAVTEVDDLQRSVSTTKSRPVIRLCTDFAFSSLWLIPRMHALRQLHPDLDLQIVATQRLAADWHEDADIAIAFGSRGEFGRDGILLMPEKVVPVCTPAFLERYRSVGGGEALTLAPLVHVDTAGPSPWFTWSSYLAETGTSRKADAVGGDLGFNTYAMVIQAALGGQGIALGWLGIVDQMLEAGLLCRAGPVLERHGQGYWLLVGKSGDPGVAQLAAWLSQEADGENA
jgi:putative choline sulfate-utilization transcription factor